MPQPLVLRLGRIAEENPAEAGTYPLLRLVAGRLVAGGSGANLTLINGRMVQDAPVVIGGMWDGGATVWDGETSWADAAWTDATWDGATDWSE